MALQMVPRYQNLLHGAELVESQLKESFSEYLNAEVALRTVTDVSMAIAWLKGSFFYIRVRPLASYNVVMCEVSNEVVGIPKPLSLQHNRPCSASEFTRHRKMPWCIVIDFT